MSPESAPHLYRLTMSNWKPIRTADNKLLCKIDPERLVLEFKVHRQLVEIDLSDYISTLPLDAQPNRPKHMNAATQSN